MLVALIAGIFLVNRALEPIHASWSRQQQFVADASHELRTLLAVLRVSVDVLFFRHNAGDWLLINVGIVVVFAALGWRFLRK